MIQSDFTPSVLKALAAELESGFATELQAGFGSARDAISEFEKDETIDDLVSWLVIAERVFAGMNIRNEEEARNVAYLYVKQYL